MAGSWIDVDATGVWATSSTITTGTVVTVDASPALAHLYPAKAEGAMEWLDRRVDEMRVRL